MALYRLDHRKAPALVVVSLIVGRRAVPLYWRAYETTVLQGHMQRYELAVTSGRSPRSCGRSAPGVSARPPIVEGAAGGLCYPREKKYEGLLRRHLAQAEPLGLCWEYTAPCSGAAALLCPRAARPVANDESHPRQVGPMGPVVSRVESALYGPKGGQRIWAPAGV